MSRGPTGQPPSREGPTSPVREPGASPLPGYRLMEPLGKGGFGEVWKCEAPGGILKAIKFIKGSVNSATTGVQAAQEYNALRKIVGIRHPFLLSMDRIEEVDGELLIVMELADQTLFDLFEAYRRAEYAGIPRDELIGYISEAAEALDLMNGQYNLQHLDIKPGNLFLIANHVKVADFGLVGDLGQLPASEAEGVIEPIGITPLYVAPEVLHGKPSAFSDQYSLAIVYQELLTGTLPFIGKNSRSLAMQHVMADPALEALPVKDVPIVAKALSKEPTKRFPSCLAFVQALITGEVNPTASKGNLTRSMSIIRVPGLETKGEINLLAEDTKPSGAVTTPLGGQQQRTTQRLQEIPRNTALNPPSSLLGEDEVLPGYQYLDLIGRSPLGELWKVKAPDQKKKLAKIVTGFEGQDTKDEARAVAMLGSIRHQGILSFELIYKGPGRLALIYDAVEETLWDRFQSYRSQRLQGIPRHELINYMKEAAETLDDLRERLELLHMALNPRNMVLPENDALLIMDFGLAHLLWFQGSQPVAPLNQRYSANELAENQIARSTDQYTLAVIYQELLTGVHPFKKFLSVRPGGMTRSQRGQQRVIQPELDPLPAPDRPIIMQALHPDPQQRFQSCMEFVEMLEMQDAAVDDQRRTRMSMSQIEISNATWFDLPQESGETDTQAAIRVVNDLVQSLAAHWPIETHGGMRYIHRAGETIIHRCGAMLPAGLAQAKLEGFRQSCGAQLVRGDDQFYVFRMFKPRSFWQTVRGLQPGLEISLRLQHPTSKAAMLTEVTVQITPINCEPDEGTELLKNLGPKIIEQVRTYLQATQERHNNERYEYSYPFSVQPVYPRGEMGELIQCQGKDISVGGMSFYSPIELPTPQMVIHLMGPQAQISTPVPACVVRTSACQDSGWYEVGIKFLFDGVVGSYE